MQSSRSKLTRCQQPFTRKAASIACRLKLRSAHFKLALASVLIAFPASMFVSGPLFDVRAAKPSAPLHILSIPYYSVKGDWESLLTLDNTSHGPLIASLTLYSLDGTALQLPDVLLQPSGVEVIQLGRLIPEFRGGSQFQEGSVEMRFNSDDGMALAPQLTVSDSVHGLSFDIEPSMELKSSTLESLWWSLDEKTGARVMLSNTTAGRLDAQINIEWRGIVIPAPGISLSAHQTTVLDIGSLLKSLNISAKGIESGGISITHSGAAGALIAQGVVEDPGRRFASNLNFFDPAAQKTSVLDGSGLMLGHPSLGDAFNESLFYTPQLVLRNRSKANQTATVTVRYTGNGREGAKALPAGGSAPHEVRMVDFRKLVAGLRNISVRSAGLEVASTGVPGSLIAMLT